MARAYAHVYFAPSVNVPSAHDYLRTASADNLQHMPWFSDGCSSSVWFDMPSRTSYMGRVSPQCGHDGEYSTYPGLEIFSGIQNT